MRAIPVKIKNVKGFTGVTPTKYVIRSFGVPGIRKMMKSSRLSFLVFCKKRQDWSFSRGTNASTIRIPNSFVSPMMMSEPIAVPSIHSAIPHQLPNA